MNAQGSTGRAMSQDGKTLMELMVVGALIGILTSLAVPNFLSWMARAQAASATEEIASELRLARQLAIARRERIRVVFDLEQQVLAVQFANTGHTDHLSRYSEKGIVVEEPSAGPVILFHPSGRSATATTIRLTSRDGRVQTLTVSMTGRVSIQ